MAPLALPYSLACAFLFLASSHSTSGFQSMQASFRGHTQQQHSFRQQIRGDNLVSCDASFLPFDNERDEKFSDGNIARRRFVTSVLTSSLAFAVGSPEKATAAASSTATAEVTDKIFIEFKGIPSPSQEGGDIGASYSSSDRIVIGLFGKDAPQPVSVLKQLVTKGGYKSKCKPLDTTRLLQKEQLEANKVHNACLENEDIVGVNYDMSLVWRVLKDQRIDVGAVSGRFVARENPDFEDAKNGLTNAMPGVVSVRRGDEGGYGFTIYPGERKDGGGEGASFLDEDNVVVGRVIEGMDVVKRLNELPVVKSSGLNYMALTGGPNTKNAPSRACRYGGPMYCNENKPLKKVLLEKTGLL